MMTAVLLDHLWQSTVFAVVAWGVARALDKSRARVRFWVWFAASLKFLVPFAALSALGVLLAPWFAGERVSTTFELPRAVGTLFSPAMSTVSTSPKSILLFDVGAMAWVSGCLALLGRWWLQWQRIRGMVASGVPAGFMESLPVLISPLVSEPGVAGIVRPVLLLPEGMSERLSAGELRAILAHEVCHVRHRDNFFAIVHGFVEVAFWFHPLIWWIGARLIEERERACDEEVVRGGHARKTYAKAILKVCRSSVSGRPSLVAGVSGADLMTRLEAIMNDQVTSRLSAWKKWMLAIAVAAVLGVPLVLGLASPLAHAGSARASTAGKIELLPGKRVRLDFDHVEVRSLLQSLAQAADVNMLVSDKVVGAVTVHLAEMPWEQALNVVLQSQGLSRRESGGIMIVEPSAANSAR